MGVYMKEFQTLPVELVEDPLPDNLTLSDIEQIEFNALLEIVLDEVEG